MQYRESKSNDAGQFFPSKKNTAKIQQFFIGKFDRNSSNAPAECERKTARAACRRRPFQIRLVPPNSK